MQSRQLLARIIETIDFRESLQPRLTALLAHDATRAPSREGVVESLVRRTYRLLIPERYSHVIEALQIAHTVVRSGRHHPGIAAFTQDMREAAVVLEQKDGLRR